jgi:hypothetical protein
VPDLWDRMPDAPIQSELNPLTNPVLERNLVRWAQVYFSSPPGKREQAVNKLLEEIKREASGSRAAETQDVICSACQTKNSVGHKFCGRCGEALHPMTSGSSENPGATAAHPETSVQWLRDRAFSSLAVSDAPKQRGWLYLVGALAIALAGFAYLQWAPGFQAKPALQAKLGLPAKTGGMPSAPSAPTEGAPQTEIQHPAEAISPSSTAATNPKTSGTQNALAARIQDDRGAVPAGLQPAVQRSPLIAGAPPRQVSDEESGAPDLRLAQRYLGGSMGVRDSSEAATLLWKAVRKQNTTAAVLLSDLYARGDGVPRSCDQARLLLLAAAKRGSPQAATQLRQLESHGCQ